MGDPSPVETSAFYRCWLWQTQRTEATDNEDTQFEQWSVAFEPDTEIDGSARFTVDGVTYQLYGPPWTVLNPRTRRVSHLEATARRVT
jgi:hypothetical protein